jgi:hypothetical protein
MRIQQTMSWYLNSHPFVKHERPLDGQCLYRDRHLTQP